ncbi:MAG: thioredoxin family protein [Verrucomicrobia bacterium]|nr:thioredoxin family protein [Verrucomicrobiota bacterium]
MKLFPILLLVVALTGQSACSRGTAVDDAAPTGNQTNAPMPTVITPGEWTQDLDAALALGREQQMPLFLNFTGSDWCGVCIDMQKRIFSKPEWQAFAASNLVLVALDFPRKESLTSPAYRARNEALARQLGVEGYPTFIVVDPVEMSAIGRLGAYRGMTKKDLIREVRHAIRLTAGAIARAEAGMAPDRLPTYRETLAKLRAVHAEAADWFATRPKQNDSRKRYGAFMKSLEGLHAEADRLEDGTQPAQ